NARTPQQNGVAKRRNKTLTEAARTMLADAKLSVTFWAEAFNTACYVQNDILVIKPHNKTPYELFNEKSPTIGFLRPLGCHVKILNTLDHLGKFDAKRDEGYFVGYSLSSKAFRVFNKITKKIEEDLHMDFLENRSIEKGTGPNWYKKDVHQAVKEKESPLRFIALPNCTKVSTNDSFELASSSTVETKVPIVITPIPTGSLSVPLITLSVPRIISKEGSSFPKPLSLGNAMSFENRLEDFFGDTSDAVSLNDMEADLSNMETAIQVSPTPTLRIQEVHPKSQIIGHVDTSVQTRQKTKNVDEQSFIDTINQKTNSDLLQYYLISCFLSQEEPKKIVDAHKDPSYVEAMKQELLQFKIQNDWVLVDHPKGVRPIGMKWGLKNKKDERGIVIRNKARLVAQGVYKVEKAMYGLHQALRAWCGTLSKYLLDNGFQRGLNNLSLQRSKELFKLIKWYQSQVKTLMDRENPWGKDGTDSNYGGANQDRKSTTGGCQFLGRRLISWQCKKQTIVATSTTEVEYVAAASGCGEVLMIQN
nr:putative ribonuclease H-like domain-containing protein [Tanacetum cinerariifolium]